MMCGCIRGVTRGLTSLHQGTSPRLLTWVKEFDRSITVMANH